VTRGQLSAQTPAQRVIDLQIRIAALERDLAEAEAQKSRAENDLRRYRELGGVSFGAIPAAQTWTDLILWESLLNDHRFDAIFELGTWQGGFSWWLWAQCEAREPKLFFQTYDAVEPQRFVPSFRRLDVFAESASLINRMRSWEPIILLCDNGNKPRELQTFATQLGPESLTVVHDWGTEVHPEDVPDTLEMVYGDFCEEIGSMSRVFRKRDV
jgi:hypothetical protein